MANLLARVAGRVCELLLPIKYEIFYGNRKSNIAVCTLSSMDLLEQVSRSQLINEVAVAARLFSENRGIEKLIKYILDNPDIRYIVLCGKDTKGHLPGQALISLHKNGVDSEGRIIGALGRDPIFENVTRDDAEEFRKRIEIIDLMGIMDIDEISARIAGLVKR